MTMADNRTKHLDIRFTPSGLDTFNTAYAASIYKTKEDFLLSLCQAKGNPPADTAEEEVPKSKEDVIHIRILAAQKKQILNLFHSSSEKSLGVFLYHAVKKVPIQVKEVKVFDTTITHELKKMGANLNQLALKANQGNDVDEELKLQLDGIKDTLYALCQTNSTNELI